MHFPLLNDILVIFALSSVVLLVCHRIKLPTIVGFLLTGLLVGPHGLELIEAVHEVEQLAEIGIVLLLFTIGLEMSLGTLLEAKKTVLVGGGLQVGLSVAAAWAIAWQGGRSPEEALFIGFLVSLSSTAIVLKLLQDRGEIDSPHGRLALGVLIFQDIVAIPMMLLTPILAGDEGGEAVNPLQFVGMVAGIIGLLIAGARWLMPFALHQVARTQNRELFLVSIITVCFAVAWLTSSMGLSLALGAFLAGLIVSESEYSHQAVSYILPFRDIFSSFFFVSIGMLLDTSVLVQQPLLVAGLTLGVLALKSAIAGFSTLVLGFPLRTAVLGGFGLSQVGEFSFVLARGGLEYHLVTQETYTLFLAVSVMTMTLTPLVMALAPRVARTSARWPVPERLKTGLAFRAEDAPVHQKEHLIIVGFGFNGQSVARAAAACKLPYVILETQPDTVSRERANGEPILFGDATQEQVLQHVGIHDARVVVVAISDPAATRLVTAAVRRLSSSVHLIVRTRYIRELEPLYKLGANEVIPEEYETAVEIFTRVLNEYLVPRGEIEQLISRMRGGGYEMLRSFSLPEEAPVADVRIDVPDIDLTTLAVEPEAVIAGQSIAALELRKRHGVTLLLIRRGERQILNPSPDMRIEVGDVLTLVGTAEQIAQAAPLFEKARAGDQSLSSTS